MCIISQTSLHSNLAKFSGPARDSVDRKRRSVDRRILDTWAEKVDCGCAGSVKKKKNHLKYTSVARVTTHAAVSIFSLFSPVFVFYLCFLSSAPARPADVDVFREKLFDELWGRWVRCRDTIRHGARFTRTGNDDKVIG